MRKKIKMASVITTPAIFFKYEKTFLILDRSSSHISA